MADHHQGLAALLPLLAKSVVADGPGDGWVLDTTTSTTIPFDDSRVICLICRLCCLAIC